MMHFEIAFFNRSANVSVDARQFAWLSDSMRLGSSWMRDELGVPLAAGAGAGGLADGRWYSRTFVVNSLVQPNWLGPFWLVNAAPAGPAAAGTLAGIREWYISDSQGNVKRWIIGPSA